MDRKEKEEEEEEGWEWSGRARRWAEFKHGEVRKRFLCYRLRTSRSDGMWCSKAEKEICDGNNVRISCLGEKNLLAPNVFRPFLYHPLFKLEKAAS